MLNTDFTRSHSFFRIISWFLIASTSFFTSASLKFGDPLQYVRLSLETVVPARELYGSPLSVVSLSPMPWDSEAESGEDEPDRRKTVTGALATCETRCKTGGSRRATVVGRS